MKRVSVYCMVMALLLTGCGGNDENDPYATSSTLPVATSTPEPPPTDLERQTYPMNEGDFSIIAGILMQGTLKPYLYGPQVFKLPPGRNFGLDRTENSLWIVGTAQERAAMEALVIGVEKPADQSEGITRTYTIAPHAQPQCEHMVALIVTGLEPLHSARFSLENGELTLEGPADWHDRLADAMTRAGWIAANKS